MASKLALAFSLFVQLGKRKTVNTKGRIAQKKGLFSLKEMRIYFEDKITIFTEMKSK